VALDRHGLDALHLPFHDSLVAFSDGYAPPSGVSSHTTHRFLDRHAFVDDIPGSRRLGGDQL
jgi:hypothetical protein